MGPSRPGCGPVFTGRTPGPSRPEVLMSSEPTERHSIAVGSGRVRAVGPEGSPSWPREWAERSLSSTHAAPFRALRRPCLRFEPLSGGIESGGWGRNLSPPLMISPSILVISESASLATRQRRVWKRGESVSSISGAVQSQGQFNPGVSPNLGSQSTRGSTESANTAIGLHSPRHPDRQRHLTMTF
jgi:hypothetical protein